MQVIEWPNMDKSATFRAMDSMKDAMFSDEKTDNNWVRENDVKGRVNRIIKQAEREARDRFLTGLYKETDMSRNDITKLSITDIPWS